MTAGGVLDVDLNAAGDTATINANPASIKVMDNAGNTYGPFNIGQVLAIDVLGTDLSGTSGETITLNGNVSLSGLGASGVPALYVTNVATATLNGQYTVSSAYVAADNTLNLGAGSLLSSQQNLNGDTGNLILSAPTIISSPTSQISVNQASGTLTLTGNTVTSGLITGGVGPVNLLAAAVPAGRSRWRDLLPAGALPA